MKQDHESIITMMGCEDTWKIAIIFSILMFIFDIFCGKTVVK